MPIDTKHPEYNQFYPLWEKCEDFVAGEEEVKDKGEKYLPKLSGQSPLKYANYKQRAIFYAAAARTVAGLVGAIFRKAPVISLPKQLEYLRVDATGTGMSLTEVAIRSITEIMITGRMGIIVDRPETGGLSYVSIYDADDIINWSTEPGNEFIVLKEDVWVSGKDKFELEEKERYRELLIDENGEYLVRIWSENEEAESDWSYVEIKPIQNGRGIPFMPFTAVAPSGLDFEIDKPPILDLVNVMEKHYQISADYANALHVTALPTPYVAADIPANEDGSITTFNIGTDTAWVLPEGSSVGFIEFTGQGLSPIEKALDKLENMLAALGARLIETRKVASVAETAEGIRTKESAATAILSQIVSSAEAGLEKILRWAAIAENADPNEVSVKLNRELVQAPLDANMLNALTKALQGGAISPELFYHNLEEAGMATPESTYELEQKRIDTYLKKQSDLAVSTAQQTAVAAPATPVKSIDNPVSK